MKENKNVPEIRFEGFTGEWEEVRLGEVLYYTQPSDYIESDFLEKGDIPVLTAGKTFILGYSNSKEKAYRNLPTILFDDFTVDTRFITFPFMVKSSATKFLNLKDENYNLKYLYYVLSNFNYSVQSHERHWISKFSKFKIPAPSLSEQQAIGQYFEKLDSLITLHQEKHQKLLDLKKAMIYKLFPKKGETVPEIRFEGFTGEWEEKQVKSFGTVITGSTPNTDTEEYWGDEYIWITPTDINDEVFMNNSERRLSNKGYSISKKLDAGSVLITCIASIGKNCILSEEGSCNQQINAIIPNNNYVNLFIYYLMEHNKSILENLAGTTATKILNKKTFEEISFFVPQKQEQQAIGQYFSKLDEIIDLNKQKIDKLKNIKSALLDKMFV